MKYCKDCEYFNGFGHCTLPMEETVRNVVDGKPFKCTQDCEMMRCHGSYCGPTAEKFKEKE